MTVAAAREKERSVVFSVSRKRVKEAKNIFEPDPSFFLPALALNKRRRRERGKETLSRRKNPK